MESSGTRGHKGTLSDGPECLTLKRAMKIGERLLYDLVRFANRKRRTSSLVHFSSYEEYFEWQYNTTARLLQTMPNLDLVGATVLELGCGTGGRTAYLASCGASRVCGIDINASE